MHGKEIIDTQRSLESGSRLGHSIIWSILLENTCFATVSVNTGVNFLNGPRTCAKEVDGSPFYINEAITGFLGQLLCRGKY